MNHAVWPIFAAIRHLIVFLLGVLIIIDGLNDATHTIPKLIIGMIMVGVLPLDSLLVFRQKQSIDHSGKCEIERHNEAPE